LNNDFDCKNEIEFCFVFQGNLALSRALGDFIFKRNADKQPEEQVVSALPDVTVKAINEDWEFVLIACDGIWDVLSNEEVLKFVRTRIAQQMPPETVEFSSLNFQHSMFVLYFSTDM